MQGSGLLALGVQQTEDYARFGGWEFGGGD